MSDKKQSEQTLLSSDFKRGWHLSDDETEKVAIGSRLKGLRQRAGNLTLDQLSELTRRVDPFGSGISRVALSRYETGAAFPGVREMKILARSLRTTISFLFYGDSEDPMNFFPPSIDLAIQDIVYQVLVAQKLVNPQGDVGPLGDEFESLLDSIKKG